MSKQIALKGKWGKGKFAIVDDEDYDRVNQYSWHLTKTGYPTRKATVVKGIEKTVLLHRIILNLDFGDSKQVDHINRNKLDARKNNLRICTEAENKRNRSSSGGTSQYKGVTASSTKGRWRATIEFNYNKYELGTYKNEIDAALAYDQAARKYHGEFAYLNFPEITDYSKLRNTSDYKTSKYIGVHKQLNRYRAYYHSKYIGSFLTEQDAYLARNKYIENLNKESSN